MNYMAHMEHHLLVDIGKGILGAGLLGFLSHYFNLPLILAYILAGVLLGSQLGFGLITSVDSIKVISEIGFVFLMFILGLEIDIKKLMQAGKAVFVNGATQFLICFALGIGFFTVLLSVGTSVGVFSGFGKYAVLYLSVACSLSSTLIVVKILSDRMELDTLPSRITLGILVIQDLWAIVFLAIQPNLSNLQIAGIAISFSKIIILVLTAFLIARFVLPYVFRQAAKQPELMLILAMTWCFSICGFADFLKLSREMGSLVAGVCIASFPYHAELASKISSLRDFFLSLFFVSLGLQIPLPTIPIIIMSVALILFIVANRFISVFPVLYAMKYGNRTSLAPAGNLSQLSEFSLVLASLGVSFGHINKDLLSIFIIVMVFMALLSSILIPREYKLYHFLNPFLEKFGLKDKVTEVAKDTEGAHHSESIEHYSGPSDIVLLGFFREASSLLHELQKIYVDKESLKKILVVDFNPEVHKKLSVLGVPCKYADLGNLETLRHLELDKAKIIISTIPDKILKGITNLNLLKFLKTIAPESKVIVTSEQIKDSLAMYEAGATYVCTSRLVTTNYLVEIILKIQKHQEHIIRSHAIKELEHRKEVMP